MKKIFKKAFIIFLSLLLFFGASYAYLYFNFNKSATKTEHKEYNIPYDKKPDNCGIAFVFPQNSAVLVHLDFENTKIKLLEIESFQIQTEYYGYTADYIVETDYEFISGLVDRMGGVDLKLDGTIMRYTGVQVIEIISIGKVEEIKKQLLLQIFERIQKNNFSKDDFVYIIENSKSDLSFVDCIYWLDYIGEMSRNVSFVN